MWTRKRRLGPTTWKAAERQRTPYYRVAERQFFAALKEQLNPIIDEALATGTITPEMASRLISEDPVRVRFEYVYRQTGADFAERIYKQFADGEQRRLFERTMEAFVREKCGERITAITNVSRAGARNIISEVIAGNSNLGAGELGRLIAAAIRKEGGIMSTWRARMIARTEVVTAANTGQQVGAEATGVAMVKVWMHSGGKDARVSHQALHGTEVGMDQKFNADGTMLSYPGDPAGPPEHVINCRCGLAHRVIE